MNKIIHKLITKTNRQLNRTAIRNKVFCIGLHKTGTTTLAKLFNAHGFKTLHSIDWQDNHAKIDQYDFFSDGGSHFDNINEIDFAMLFKAYSDSKFIYQTREPKSWVISKLKHAGWDEHTIIEPDNSDYISHDKWKYKSLLTIRKFLEHRANYERKVMRFFSENDPGRLIKIDITDRSIQETEFKKLKDFFHLKSVNRISLPHANRQFSDHSLPPQVLDYIDEVILSMKNAEVNN